MADLIFGHLALFARACEKDCFFAVVWSYDTKYHTIVPVLFTLRMVKSKEITDSTSTHPYLPTPHIPAL
jgi:hypothetical protein